MAFTLLAMIALVGANCVQNSLGATFGWSNSNTTIMAYPGSEFVVAKTLVEWKKLESNKIKFSQGFSQKEVSTSCFVFNSLPARDNFCCLLIAFANSLNPDHNVGPDLDPNSLMVLKKYASIN